jgi:acetylornithine/succinyldiaminopimelate/putrescine aminotransferase
VCEPEKQAAAEAHAAATVQRNRDPEAWLADQLAQLQTVSTDFGEPILHWSVGEEAFEAVQKLAQEYGEMCVARVTEAAIMYPVEHWIRDQKRFHGKVYQRKVMVLEDWNEV